MPAPSGSQITFDCWFSVAQRRLVPWREQERSGDDAFLQGHANDWLSGQDPWSLLVEEPEEQAREELRAELIADLGNAAPEARALLDGLLAGGVLPGSGGIRA